MKVPKNPVLLSALLCGLLIACAEGVVQGPNGHRNGQQNDEFGNGESGNGEPENGSPNGEQEYTLTYSAGSNGVILGATPQHVLAGQDGSPVEAVPDTGYVFTGWSDSITQNPRTDRSVTSDITVTAFFGHLEYVITATAGPNGSIEPSGNIAVSHGEDVSFAISPSEGYQIDSVLMNNIDVGPQEIVTLEDIDQDGSIEAHFAPSPFSFCVLTDTHYGDIADDPERPRYFRRSVENVEATVAICDQRGASFVVHLGDIVQEAGNKSDTISRMRAIDNAMTSFSGPLHYAIGNHDVGDLTKSEVLANTSGYQSSRHYSFEQGEYVFLVLDANFRGDGTEYGEGNFNWEDAYIPASQRAWISNALEDAANGDKKAIVLLHHVIDDREGRTRINNHAQIRGILEDAGNVVVVFQGHRHTGGYRYINGIHYVNVRGTVNVETYSFGLVTIQGDDIHFEGHGWQPNHDLSSP